MGYKLKFGTTALYSLMIMLMITGCGLSVVNKNKKSGISDTGEVAFQQPHDLLAGVSNAVCYSGFRTGQHPDRGDGAVNPTDEQIKEDLHIISRDIKCGLIRLYDSGENSASVLKIISENKIDIKVMLGIWLKAELSNHKSCAWLTEPIPNEVLALNKQANQNEIQKGIRLANQYPGIVVAVNVGNEAMVDWNDHKVDVDTIISYVRTVKKLIKQPVTVADNYEWISAWAAKMNITTFFFEAFDEDWKGNLDDAMGAEKHWGLYRVDRTPKKVLQTNLLKQGS